MTTVFDNYDKTLEMVEGAYRKLKSYIFYDKTLLYIKKQIAEFECRHVSFEDDLKKIANALVKNDWHYFENLISNINYKIFPKKFVSLIPNADVVCAAADHDQHICKLNFFIDMPIELHIVDFLWTLFIGKIMNEYKDEYYKYAAATAFKPRLFNENHSLTDGVDYSSNRAFVPYFTLYSDWRDDAFKTIENRNKSEYLILMCLDLKSFYYTVEFNFNDLKKYLHNDERIDSFAFLTKIIHGIYTFYHNKLAWVRTDVKKTNGRNCIFPIGVTSVLVLRELYLSNFDGNMCKNLSPYYYSRYVDDMLIVIKADKDDFHSDKSDLIQKYLLKLAANENADGDITFVGYNNIKVQKEKINCFFFPKDRKPIILDVYKELINKNSSEANLLPDESILNSSFTQYAYYIQNIEISNKLRDVGILLSNNFRATCYLSNFANLLKNTAIDHARISEFFDQVEEFYNGSSCIEYSNSWNRIFELYLLCDEKKRGRSFYLKIKEGIKKLTLDHLSADNHIKRAKNVLAKLTSSLQEKLDIAIALAGAANSTLLTQKRLSKLAQAFRISNMFNHKLTAYPLLNYSKNNTMSLTEINLETIRKNKNAFDRDEIKFKWSPRYIHFYELCIAAFMYCITCNNNELDLNKLFNFYLDYNNIDKRSETAINEESKKFADKIVINICNINKKEYAHHKIAIVNTKIDENEVLGFLSAPYSALSLQAKLNLFKCLNNALENHVEFLIFPEFYLPAAWLADVASFAIKHDITVITGLQYIALDKTAHNNVCIFIPHKIDKNFKLGLLRFREKNFYAPKEKLFLSQKGYSCMDASNPLYNIYKSQNVRFSNILCYEFTDIISRAALKSNIEIAFVPQVNRDTNYFSAIVESAARDLHCFIVQANTSNYGDSRITAPYDTLHKNIVLVKGGETDVVMIGEAKINDLLDFRRNDNPQLEAQIKCCLQCKKPYSRKDCRHCELNKLESSKSKSRIIKWLPPLFDINDGK